MNTHTETKHTPGPWRLFRATPMPRKTPPYPESEKYDERSSWKVLDNDATKGNPMMNGNLICHVYNHASKDCSANARLIAAAPDMYAMLKEVHHLLNQETLNGEEGWGSLVREIGQLLTKATEDAQ